MGMGSGEGISVKLRNAQMGSMGVPLPGRGQAPPLQYTSGHLVRVGEGWPHKRELQLPKRVTLSPSQPFAALRAAAHSG